MELLYHRARTVSTAPARERGKNMNDNQANPVPSANQNKGCFFPELNEAFPSGKRYLFVGNSVTKHGPKPDIGWNQDNGMAASDLDHDYVHILKKRILAREPDASIAILQVAFFERAFWEPDILDRCKDAIGYHADTIVLFFGANVPKDYDAGTLKPAISFGEAYEKLRAALAPDKTQTVIHLEGFYIRPVLEAEKKIVAEKYGDRFLPMDDIRARDDVRGRFNHPSDTGMLAIADRIWEAIG